MIVLEPNYTHAFSLSICFVLNTKEYFPTYLCRLIIIRNASLFRWITDLFVALL